MSEAKPVREPMDICEDCAGTGFTDKVSRSIWSFRPAEKLCPVCCGRGWIPAAPPLETAMGARAVEIGQ